MIIKIGLNFGGMDLDNELKNFLEPSPVVDCDNPVVRNTAIEVTAGKKDDIEKAVALFYFVRDTISYTIYLDKYLAEHFRASNTLALKQGYCVQKAVLLAALARAVGIPAGIGFARMTNHLIPEKMLKFLGSDIFPCHGYTELFLDGKWVKATSAMDIETCKKGRLIPVEFDGRNDALYPARNRDGKLSIEYLKFLGRYEDVPLEKLWTAVTQQFGPQFLRPSEYR
jgi:transglutaminase-like putative cysteine protease